MPSPFSLQFPMKIPPEDRSNSQNGVIKPTNMEQIQLSPFYVTANNNGHLTSPLSEDPEQQIPHQKQASIRQNQQIQHQTYQESPKQQQIPHKIYQESPKQQQIPLKIYQESPKQQQIPHQIYQDSPKQHQMYQKSPKHNQIYQESPKQQQIQQQICQESPKNQQSSLKQYQNYAQLYQNQQIRSSIQDADNNAVVNNSEVIVIEDDEAQEEGWINDRMKEAGAMDSTSILESSLGAKNFNTILSWICKIRNMHTREMVLRAFFSNQRSYKATGMQTQEVQILNGITTQREDRWYITPNAEGLMPIHRSVVEGTGDLEADALALIRTGKHIDQRTTCPDKLTPLQLCILRGCGTETLLRLLDLGCAAVSTDAAGRNALHLAVLAAPADTAALLARHAVNTGQDLFAAVTGFDIDGYTPIMRSVLLQKPDHLKTMLETMAHENARKFAVNLANPINGRTALSLLENGDSADLRMCRKLLNSYGATQKAGAPAIIAAPSPVPVLPVITNPPSAKPVPLKQDSKPTPPKVRTSSPSKHTSKSTPLQVRSPNLSKRASEPSLSQAKTHSSSKTTVTLSKPVPTQGRTPPSSKSRKHRSSKTEVNKIITGDGEITIPLRHTVKTPPVKINDIIKKRTELPGNKIASNAPNDAQSSENLFVLKGDGKKKKSDSIRPVNMTVIVPETLKDITMLNSQSVKESNWVNCIVTKVGTNFSECKNVEINREDSLIDVITSPDRLSDLVDGLDYITDDHDAPSYIGSLVEIPYLEENADEANGPSPIIQQSSKREQKKYEYLKNQGMKRKKKSTDKHKVKLQRTVSSSKKDVTNINDEDLVLQLSISSIEDYIDKEMLNDSPVKWKDQIMRKHTMQMNLEDHILNNPAMQPHVLLRRVRLAKGQTSVKLNSQGLINRFK